MKVYKFCSVSTDAQMENLRRSIENSYVWHSAPKYFNDAFDCTAYLTDIQNFREVTESNPSSRVVLSSEQGKRDYFNWLIQVGLGVACFIKGDIDETDQDGPLNNTMMWGQYTDHSKGVCLEFDLEKLEKTITLNDVDYGKVLPSLNFADFTKKDKKKEAFLVKHDSWKEESEARSIIFDVPRDAPGKGVDFEPDALLGVYAGYRFFHGDKYHFNKLDDTLKNRKGVELYFPKRGKNFSLQWEKH